MEEKSRKIDEVKKMIIQRRKKKFKIIFFFSFFSFIIFTFYYLERKIINFLWNGELFKIKEIKIYPEDISPLIKEFIGLEIDKNLLFLNMEEIRTKILSIPEVEDCKIIKDFPSFLQINIILRLPWAVLKTNQKEYLIDKNGIIINGKRENVNFEIYGIKVNEVENKIEENGKIKILNEFYKWYNYYNISNFFKVKIVDISDLNKIEVSDGERKILFRNEAIKEKMEKLAYILKNLKNDFEYIDTRFKDFYVKFKNDGKSNNSN
jgi:cell division septal protein FtsQ